MRMFYAKRLHVALGAAWAFAEGPRMWDGTQEPYLIPSSPGGEGEGVGRRLAT